MKKNRTIISSDVQEANFREIRMGSIAPKTLYRSSHPIKDNGQERAHAILAAKTSIASVLNLCDTESGLQHKAFFAPWYSKLYKNNRIIALGMDFGFTSERFNKKLNKALQFIIKNEGPYLIHCHAGIDRTGFVSMVLESLMGATFDEILDDYVKSFYSSFESSIYSGTIKDNYQVHVMQHLAIMGGSSYIIAHDLQVIAEHYLENTIGLTADEIVLLKGKLSGDMFPGCNMRKT